MSKRELTEAARIVLSQCTVEGNNIKLPPEELPRELYLEVKKHLELIGGKWKGGKTMAFVYEQDPTELLAMQANGEGKDLKKEFQFFPTPSPVAALMMKHLPFLPEGAKFLEPSAGRGALVEALRMLHPEVTVECFELMEINRLTLEKVPGIALFKEPDFLKAVDADKNATEKHLAGRYDVIIANPPFTKNQDIDHIKAMFYCLKAGGTLISLASPSWTFGESQKQTEFRDWLNFMNAVSKPLEQGSFKESGTAITPVLLVIEKPATIVVPEASTTSEVKESEKVSSNRGRRPSKPIYKEITVTSGQLLTALKKTKGIIPKEPVVSCLSDVLLQIEANELLIVATDLEVTMISRIECNNIGFENFKALLPFDFLYRIANLSVGEISIKVSADTAIINTYNATFEQGSLNNVADFPVLPEMPKEHSITINNGFIDWLGKAFATAGTDALRPAMTYVCLDIISNGITMVSTNSHVLFTKTFEVFSSQETQLLISQKIAKALAGFAETTVYWADNHAAFQSDNVTVIAKRPDVKFPEYKAVIPAYHTNLEINRNELIASLEKADLASGSSHMANFYLKAKIGVIDIKAADLDHSREVAVELTGDYLGECDKVVVNPSILIKLLHQVEYENIGLAIHNENRAILLRSLDDHSYLALQMPLQNFNLW